MKYLIWISLLLPVWLPAPAMLLPQEERELFPISFKSKVGYIDVTGRVVIEPKFPHFPSGGEVNGHFDDEQYFKEGLVLASDGTRRGFIDKTGRFVIEGPYLPYRHFSDGLAQVSGREDRSKTGFIDKSGKLVIPPQFDRAESFSEGLAAVQINNKWGYVDKTGVMVIPPGFDVAASFSDGFAYVGNYAQGSGDINGGHINKAGEFFALPGGLEEMGSLQEGLIAVMIKGKWGFINPRGQIVIAPQFEDQSDQDYWPGFVNGLAEVKSNGKWGYINRSGKFAIPPQFDEAKPFDGNIAAVYLNGKWGYINRRGQFVAPPQFDEADRFADGFAAVSIDGKWGYIDQNGKLIIKPQFTSAHYFSEGSRQHK